MREGWPPFREAAAKMVPMKLVEAAEYEERGTSKVVAVVVDIAKHPAICLSELSEVEDRGSQGGLWATEQVQDGNERPMEPSLVQRLAR